MSKSDPRSQEICRQETVRIGPEGATWLASACQNLDSTNDISRLKSRHQAAADRVWIPDKVNFTPVRAPKAQNRKSVSGGYVFPTSPKLHHASKEGRR